MTAPSIAKPTLAASCATLCLALAACGSAVSTTSFSGEQRQVAQEISNFQSHVTAAEQAKICSADLSSELVARLHAAPGGCTAVIKEQLAEVDTSTLTISSIQLGGGSPRTARASVKSTYAGKTRTATLLLVKQNGAWKVAGVA